MTADATAELFTHKLIAQEPFVHIRFGDADYDWMMGGSGHTCDGEFPRPGIGQELLAAWEQLWSRPDFYLGDIESFRTPAAEPIRKYAASLTAGKPADRLVHTEALLIHRLTFSLLSFYVVLWSDRRSKVLVSASRTAKGAAMLNARHVEVDVTKANQEIESTIERIEAEPWDILLTCCGRASKLIAGSLAVKYPERTIIELGSGLDPLFVGKTRSEQIPMAQARAYFREML